MSIASHKEMMWKLMIGLKQNDGVDTTWIYKEFRVDGPETNYVLHIGEAEKVEGLGGNVMGHHNGRPFTTIHRDNDAYISNCAAAVNQGNGGGWWYNNCYTAALTRPHTGNSKIYWGGTYYPHVEIKIRPKTCLNTFKQPQSCE